MSSNIREASCHYPVQGRLEDLAKETISVCVIPEGVVIFPEYTGRGVTRHPVFAERLRREIKGEKGYQAREVVGLFFDGDYWSIPSDSCFGYSGKVHRRTISRKSSFNRPKV